MVKLILFDLDETLLRSDKTVSRYSAAVLERCRKKGIITGFSTARDLLNIRSYVEDIRPELIISSGGAFAAYRGETVYSRMFSEDETRSVIDTAFALCGGDCEITVDTETAHYWNSEDIANANAYNWLNVAFTDYSDFRERAYKICVMTDDGEVAGKIAAGAEECLAIPFSDIPWYKFSKKDAVKEKAILAVSERLGIDLADMLAFGDDYGDIGMLRMCGTGAAVENAIPEVKEAADIVVGSNNDDGPAHYIEEHILDK